MIKGYIFDLDGVIVFTDKYHYNAWKQMADSEGIYFDEQINNRLRGVSRAESLEIVLERANRFYTPIEKSILAEQKNEHYKKLLEKLTPNDVSLEVKDTLFTLKNKGFKLAIGSSSKNAKFILQKIGLSGFFDAVSDGNNIEKSKPDPEVFLKAATMIGLAPCDCIVVEDALAGIDAAIKGGFTTAAIGDALGHKHKNIALTAFSDLLK